MIKVTERAKKQLKWVLSEHVDMPQAGIRLVDKGEGQIGLGIDIENPGDQVVEFEGSQVLMVEENLANNLDGITLDLEETDEGAKLVLIEDAS